jgi:hypothetical protein
LFFLISREGVKKGGKWEGEAIYTFTEGPRAGKRYRYIYLGYLLLPENLQPAAVLSETE